MILRIAMPDLRVSGDISLLKFSRLSDLVNHNRGYIRLGQLRDGDEERPHIPQRRSAHRSRWYSPKRPVAIW